MFIMIALESMRGGASGKIADRADVLLVLRALRHVDRVMAAVVRSRRDLVDEQLVVRGEKELDAVRADDAESAPDRSPPSPERVRSDARAHPRRRDRHREDAASRAMFSRDGIRDDSTGALRVAMTLNSRAKGTTCVRRSASAARLRPSAPRPPERRSHATDPCRRNRPSTVFRYGRKTDAAPRHARDPVARS